MFCACVPFLARAEDNESDTNTSSTADEERSMVASITSVPVGRTVNAAGDFHAPQHQPPASSATIVKKLKDGPGRTESPSDGHMTQVLLLTGLHYPLISNHKQLMPENYLCITCSALPPIAQQ